MNAGKRSVTCELRLESRPRPVPPPRRGGRRRHRDERAWYGEGQPAPTPRTLQKVNPGAVVVSITNYGQDRPRPQPPRHRHRRVGDGRSHVPQRQRRARSRPHHPHRRPYAQVNLQGGCRRRHRPLCPRRQRRGRAARRCLHAGVHGQRHGQRPADLGHPPDSTTAGPDPAAWSAGAWARATSTKTADGWVAALGLGGLIGPNSAVMIDWLDQTGEAGPLTSPHWRERLSVVQPLEDGEQELVVGLLQEFCRTRRKDDLVREAQARGAGWAPVLQPPRDRRERPARRPRLLGPGAPRGHRRDVRLSRRAVEALRHTLEAARPRPPPRRAQRRGLRRGSRAGTGRNHEAAA